MVRRRDSCDASRHAQVTRFIVQNRVLVSATMSTFEADHVYTVQTRDIPRNNLDEHLHSEIERQLQDFLLQYRVNSQFIYSSVIYKP